MKFNISKKDARFIVNKDKRKVVCLIEDTGNCFIDFVAYNLPIKTYCNSLREQTRFEDKLFMPKRFVGVATCGENDEWNEEIGKLIAFSRAKDNLNKAFFKRAKAYIDTLDDWLSDAVEQINGFGEKVEINTNRRHNRINELLGDGE